MQNKSLIIVGTGDYAEMAFRYILRDRKIEIVAFSVEKEYMQSETFCSKPVIAFENITKDFDPSEHCVLVAVGPNKVNTVRQRLFEEALNKGYEPFTYVSREASIWDESAIGKGSFIFDQCVIEPGAKIGLNSVLWSGAIVAHHSTVGNHCFLAPGSAISGRITIGNNCFLGINCTIRDNVTVANNCIIGGGAVIKKSTVENGVYSANPTELRNEASFNTKV